MAVSPFGVLTAVLFIFAFGFYRLYAALVTSPKIRLEGSSRSTRSLAVFLGSGGHTSEALQLLSSLDFTRYRPRTYIISEGDHLSAVKATTLESAKASLPEDYDICVIPRARRVHQSLLSTPLSALNTLLACTYYLTIEPLMFQKGSRMLTDVLILNGPGTCTILCLAAFFNRGYTLRISFTLNLSLVSAPYPCQDDYFDPLLIGLSFNGPNFCKMGSVVNVWGGSFRHVQLSSRDGRIVKFVEQSLTRVQKEKE